MEEKELRTSPKQRIFIAVIAIIMVGSIVAGYAAIVLNNSNSASSETEVLSAERMSEYQQAYDNAASEFAKVTQADFETFSPYKSEIKAFNEASANENGLQTTDLVVGDGRELTDGDTDYRAFYIGWCADETVFDTNMDNPTNPTKFINALDPSVDGGLIEGWEMGVQGMKLNGIREVTIPGELGYKDTRELCGGTYKPLKFVIMAVANEEPLTTAVDNLEVASTKLQYAQYGIDYDLMLQQMQEAQNSQDTQETQETSGE